MSRERCWFEDGLAGLLTDLYEITMTACYYEQAMEESSTFSLFVRRLPENRSFLLAAGLDDALTYLENLQFSLEAVDYLRSTGLFRDSYLQYLAGLRFNGDVFAVPEGTVVFENEPLLEVTAPVAQAQIAETYLLAAIQLQTLMASKAARLLFASRGRPVVDFGARRAHGMEAAVRVARAAYIAGLAGTSNVMSGMQYGIPVVGTMAHSYIQAFEDETEAFRAFSKLFPDNSVLLVDTYDCMEGVRRAASVGREMSRAGGKLRGIRLDSGDMVRLSAESRKILDDSGLEDVQIFASGSLNEYRIEELLAEEAPIDAFGVGSDLAVSYDVPGLDIVYKLVEYAGRPVLKLSQNKRTLAGRKQVFRRYSDSGEMSEDVIALREEHLEGTSPLLVSVMKNGRRLGAPEKLEKVREYAASQLAGLPSPLKALRGTAPYPVRCSDALNALQERLIREYGRGGKR